MQGPPHSPHLPSLHPPSTLLQKDKGERANCKMQLGEKGMVGEVRGRNRRIMGDLWSVHVCMYTPLLEAGIATN